MLNKAILCAIGAKKLTLVLRMKIIVGTDSNSLYLGFTDEYGSATFLEGEDILASIFVTTLGFSRLNVVLTANPSDELTVENETTGVKVKVVKQSQDMRYIGNGNLFEGIEVGQECVIAIYK